MEILYNFAYGVIIIYMQYDEEDFNSFLAGALLVNGQIKNLEFMRLCFLFESKYNVCLIDSDSYDVGNLIFQDDLGIRLLYDYNYMLGNAITVKEYLENLISDRVREFFNIDIKKSRVKSNKRVMAFRTLL